MDVERRVVILAIIANRPAANCRQRALVTWGKLLRCRFKGKQLSRRVAVANLYGVYWMCAG